MVGQTQVSRVLEVQTNRKAVTSDVHTVPAEYLINGLLSYRISDN